MPQYPRVHDQSNTVDPSGAYAPRSLKRRVDTSHWVLRKPAVMASPPTLTAGVASAASVIAGSVEVRAFTPGAFTLLGGTAARGTTYPNYTGLVLGRFPQVTSDAPTAAEFFLDTVDATGRFEIHSKGTGTPIRVCVMNSAGRWEYATTAGSFTTHPADGNLYLDLVTLGAAGKYNIRLEFSPAQVFFGVRVGPTDTVVGRKQQSRRYIVVGDSFSEPAIVDSGASVTADGWPVVLAHMTGLDIWCAGSGGTGYLQTNGARPKFRDRLANDVLAYNPDGIIWAGGINDLAFAASAVGAEALLCYQQVTAANPDIDQVVLSPFYPRQIPDTFVSNLLTIRDALKSSAATAGARFLGLLSLSYPDYLAAWSSSLNAQAAATATSLVVPTLPAYFVGQVGVGDMDGWNVQIGTDANAEVRSVTNVTGTPGAYTLTVAALANTHAAGQAVALHGSSYMTGTGRQGATTGTGNADRYTGSDNTHPTVPGHEFIAHVVGWLWAESIRQSG